MEPGIPDGPLFEDVLYRTCSSASEGAYAEFTCPAGTRIESVVFASYGRPAVCKAWRQTGGCNPNGPREKAGDLGCEAKIDGQRSGFCECSGGRRAGMVGCGHEEFTCAEVCAAPVTCSMWRQTGGCNPDGPREPAGDKEVSSRPAYESAHCRVPEQGRDRTFLVLCCVAMRFELSPPRTPLLSIYPKVLRRDRVRHLGLLRVRRRRDRAQGRVRPRPVYLQG